MASSDFDLIIAGTKAKIRRTENGGYTKRTIRREIENNLLSQAQNPAMTSRFDHRQLYQTSWAGGARWWKPLLTPTDLESYFQSNHMDTWSEPGKIVPGNKVVDAANTNIHDNCVIAAGNDGAVYAIGSTNTTNASFLDVYKWTPASNAFVRETGYHSGIPVAEGPSDMTLDPNDGYFYVLNEQGNEITRFNPATPAQDAAWLAVSGLARSCSVFMTQHGLAIYTGNQVRHVDTSGPTLSTTFNDGLGSDILSNPVNTNADPILRRLDPAIGTPQGIYYFKNTMTEGLPMAWIFRVERDAAGNWIGNPIGTLPPGNVVLSIEYHLGGIVITASPDWQTIVANDAGTSHAEVLMYQISGGQMGALGSLLGGRDLIDETPYEILGTNGPLLYIGGHKRLWVYDAIRGGIHTAWTWDTVSVNGPYSTMAHVFDSSGDSAMIFLAADRIGRIKIDKADDPDTVTNFGDDEAHYILTSNFFDGGLPMEIKELTKVAILRESGDGDQEWTVQISADGGSFTDALTLSTSGATYGEADLSGTTGRKFQYKLIYQTKDTNRKGLEALLISLTTGELLTEWDLVLDGTELLNVDNEVQDEEAFYDAMVAIAGTQTLINFSDNMKEQDRLTDSATTVKVKVMAVEIIKSKAGESDVRVVLREA